MDKVRLQCIAAAPLFGIEFIIKHPVEQKSWYWVYYGTSS